jgi:uncharacterized protein (UPF0371 family)
MALGLLNGLKLVRDIDRFFSAQKNLTTLLEAQSREIQTLKDRVARLEVREEVLIAEAKGAAAAAAAAIASQHLADLARHVGALDERTQALRGIKPPAPDYG